MATLAGSPRREKDQAVGGGVGAHFAIEAEIGNSIRARLTAQAADGDGRGRERTKEDLR